MTGTGTLTRFMLKRDKFFIPVWILGLAALAILVAPALDNMFTTEAERMIMGETMKNPAMIAMCGPCYDFETYSTGAMYAQMMLAWTVLLWAVMNIFLVVRHTRKDEEEGRLELIKALPTDRQASIISVIFTALIVNVLAALVVGFGLGALGIDSMSMESCLLFGACVGVIGLVFAGIALVFSQACSSARGATGFSLSILGAFYLMRAVGDISTEFLSYISPLGLVERTEVFVNDIWWPVIVVIVEAAVLFILAMLLNSRRDIEQGLIPARKGRSHASILLRSTFGLSIKLLRSTLIAWAVTIYVLGAAYGSIFGDIETFINSSDLIKQMFAGDPNANMNMQFVDTLMVIMSIVATIAVLMVILKLRGEEKRGRIDDILARNVSRGKLMANYVIIAAVFAAILQFFMALGLWQASSAVMDEPMKFGDLLESAFIYIPAMLVFIGVATTLMGIFPKGTIIAWLYLGYAFFADYIGGILDLPDWTNKITPFGQTPRVPTEEFDIVPISVMCTIFVALLVIGFIGFRNRDVKEH